MKTKITWMIWGMCALLLLVSAYFYKYSNQEQIAIHWDIVGNADGYAPSWVIFLFPLLLPLLDTMLLLASKFDRKRHNYNKFESSFQNVRILIGIFISAMCCIVQYAQLYPESVDIPVVISVLTAILCICIGNIMPRFRRNFLIGYRTPWTIKNEIVWQKTQRLSGHFLFFGGIILLLVSFLPLLFHLTLFFSTLLVMVMGPGIYSYILYRNLKRKGDCL